MGLVSKKFRLSLLVISLILVIDQITKFFASRITLSDPSTNTYHILSYFEKIYNNAGLHFFLINVRHHFVIHQLIVRMLVLPLISIYIAYYIYKHNLNSKWMLYGVCLLIGALLGNSLDIICRGYVIDWIGSSFFYKHFELNYAINIADIFALLSAPLIIIGVRTSVLTKTKSAGHKSVSKIPQTSIEDTTAA